MYRITLISLLCLLTGAASSLGQIPQGQLIYKANCVRCHGRDGTRGFLAAKNLQLSDLNDKDLYTTISEGRRVMPSWKKKLNQDQINQLVIYVKTLRITIPKR